MAVTLFGLQQLDVLDAAAVEALVLELHPDAPRGGVWLSPQKSVVKRRGNDSVDSCEHS